MSTQYTINTLRWVRKHIKHINYIKNYYYNAYTDNGRQGWISSHKQLKQNNNKCERKTINISSPVCQ